MKRKVEKHYSKLCGKGFKTLYFILFLAPITLKL